MQLVDKKKIFEFFLIIKQFIKNNEIELFTIIITISILLIICLILNWILKKKEESFEKKINKKNFNILQDSYLKKKFINYENSEQTSFLKNKFTYKNSDLKIKYDYFQNNFFDINETTILLDKTKIRDKVNSDFFGSFIVDNSFFENDLTLKFSDKKKK